VGVLHRFRGRKASETPLVLSRETVEAFVDLLSAMQAGINWRMIDPYLGNASRADVQLVACVTYSDLDQIRET